MGNKLNLVVSVVSHGHGKLVENLVKELVAYDCVHAIIVTKNIPEDIDLPGDTRITVVKNSNPLGFSKNHNNAFKLMDSEFFLVLNPDIRLNCVSLQGLMLKTKRYQLGLIAPLIKGPNGHLEDFARFFPTPLSIIRKVFLGDQGRFSLDLEKQINFPDWVAGMFMLFRSKTFHRIQGFDEEYFLYYEDVDICNRINKSDIKIGVDTTSEVIHFARRDSHRKLKNMVFHLSSMVRFFTKSTA